jgi:hypothetical protein
MQTYFKKVIKKVSVHYFTTVKQMIVLRTVFCTVFFIQVVAVAWLFFFNPSKCCDYSVCTTVPILKTVQFAHILTFIDFHVP